MDQNTVLLIGGYELVPSIPPHRKCSHPLSACYLFNLTNYHWSKVIIPEDTEAVLKRAFFGAVLLRDSLYIFGGERIRCEENGEIQFENLNIFELFKVNAISWCSEKIIIAGQHKDVNLANFSFAHRPGTTEIFIRLTRPGFNRVKAKE